MMQIPLKSNITIFICALILGASTAMAAPAELDGLGLVTSWVDVEDVSGDMPPPPGPWFDAEINQAERIGIWVQYDDGTTSWATYSDIDPGEWGTCCGVVAVEDSASGFLAGAVLHGVGRDDLPMAWESASNAYTGNFDLDYDSNFGSDWRASSGGWVNVEIALYAGNAQPTAPVPSMSSWGLITLISLIGFGFYFNRRRIIN